MSLEKYLLCLFVVASSDLIIKSFIDSLLTRQDVMMSLNQDCSH
jgi:hypothetical protein